MTQPVKSGLDTRVQSSVQQTERPLRDVRTMASPPRTPFLSRALNRLRFYRRFLCEIQLELRSLFERIQVLRRNNLFRCGIGPVTTFADIPNELATPHMRALAHSQCIQRFSSSRPRASLVDFQTLLEGWERGVESAYMWHRTGLPAYSSGSDIVEPEQNTPSIPDPQERSIGEDRQE